MNPAGTLAYLDRLRREHEERIAAESGAWPIVDFATIDTDPPPPRRWVWERMLPAGTVAAIFGPGGGGKSLLGEQLMTHVGLGESFAGLACEQGPAVGIFCEDDADELRHRMVAIQRQVGRSVASAPVYAAARAGEENVMVTFDREQMLQFTPAWGALVAMIERYRPVLLVIDNIAHVFGGNENDRRHVTQFCNALAGLARRYRAAVLLIGHAAKAEGSEFSGSTAWEAAVRTRLWLERQETGAVVLHRRKANYADRDSITLEYVDGAFALPEKQDLRAAGRLAEQTVCAGLATLTRRQVATSHSPAAAQSYLPRVLQREGLLNGVTVQAAARALGALIDSGAIEPNAPLGWKKPDRHPATGLVLRELA